ncbi:MAG: uncharacterized protein QOH76_1907 [Thermoleophilaceae bacterium]|jgi:hypothetical protein|nr:uncharacterized protein [Thermoleophilaceae bacterium]
MRARLEESVRTTDWLMRALEAARSVGAPDWMIGAGAVRTAVWDRLHGFDGPADVADVDLVFFDPADLSPERDAQVERELRAAHTEVPWDAKNQARVHLWYPRRFGRDVAPLASTAEGIATWPETATAVGLRLTGDGRLLIEAPCGLGDLLGMVHRRNPRRVTVEEYERRLATKRIEERWPRATVIPAVA